MNPKSTTPLCPSSAAIPLNSELKAYNVSLKVPHAAVSFDRITCCDLTLDKVIKKTAVSINIFFIVFLNQFLKKVKPY